MTKNTRLELLNLMKQADRVPVLGKIPRPVYLRLKTLCKAYKLRWADVLTLGLVMVAESLEDEMAKSEKQPIGDEKEKEPV